MFFLSLTIFSLSFFLSFFIRGCHILFFIIRLLFMFITFSHRLINLKDFLLFFLWLVIPIFTHSFLLSLNCFQLSLEVLIMLLFFCFL
jgi:hypothetical protein